MTPGTLHSLALAGALLAPGLIVAASGGPSVGPDAAPVRGRVTYHGRPVYDAGILFCSVGTLRDKVVSGPIARGGSFKLDLPRGRYAISILPVSRAAWTGADRPSRPDGRAVPRTLTSPGEEYVPRRFRFPATSPLSVTIDDRACHLEIDLKD
jgi:hypothetical protein